MPVSSYRFEPKRFVATTAFLVWAIGVAPVIWHQLWFDAMPFHLMQRFHCDVLHFAGEYSQREYPKGVDATVWGAGAAAAAGLLGAFLHRGRLVPTVAANVLAACVIV